jgi:hypothetical protein
LLAVDHLRQDVDGSLGRLRHALERLREKRFRGSVDWVDDGGRTARELWADRGLMVARQAKQAIAVLDLPIRRDRMTQEERREVENARPEVAEMFTLFTVAGGRLLPGDLPAE